MNENLISVFPNPTSGTFSLDVKSTGKNSNNWLTIYSVVGKVVIKKNIENTSGNFTDQIDLSSYPNGLYFIEVDLGSKKVISKLIKK